MTRKTRLNNTEKCGEPMHGKQIRVSQATEVDVALVLRVETIIVLDTRSFTMPQSKHDADSGE